MNRLAIALSLPVGAALLLQANPSHALPITVNGMDYDLFFYKGSLADFKLENLNLPWFNDLTLAADFANEFSSEGQYNTISGPAGNAFLGPLFYALSAPDTFVAWNNGEGAPNTDFNPFTGSYLCSEYDCTDTSLQWAYVTPAIPTVPAPLPLLGATAAFSFSRKLRRRVNAQKFTF